MVNNMKSFLKKYINDEIKLDKTDWIGIILLVTALSGLFGWIYEFIFYYFDSGMKHWYYQGGNFLPWINIYAHGSLLIIWLTYKFKRKPHLVFILSTIITGVLEYFAGWAIFTFLHERYWDYNTEILNWGNIDGYICFRSVFIFGIFALVLMYVMLPFLIYLAKKLNKKTFLTISIVLCSIFLIDEIYNLFITKIIGTPRAPEIYRSIGIMK